MPPLLDIGHFELPPELAGLKERIHTQPPEILVLSAFALGSVTTLATAKIYARYFRRLRTSDWITPDVFVKKRWIKGVVTTVGDADNFRLYHTPAFGWRWPLKFRRVPLTKVELKDQTIHIRMAGIDAPEAAHFGNPAQEYVEEALAWTKQQVEGKTIYCQLIDRDRYSRTIAIPMLPPRLLPGFLTPRYGKCLSLEMLRAGWAVTYVQAGAAYGPWGMDVFQNLEAKAKLARVGQWVNGVTGESPSEYKRRHAQKAAEPAAGEADLEKAKTTIQKRRGWFAWFFGK